MVMTEGPLNGATCTSFLNSPSISNYGLPLSPLSTILVACVNYILSITTSWSLFLSVVIALWGTRMLYGRIMQTFIYYFCTILIRFSTWFWQEDIDQILVIVFADAAKSVQMSKEFVLLNPNASFPLAKIFARSDFFLLFWSLQLNLSGTNWMHTKETTL